METKQVMGLMSCVTLFVIMLLCGLCVIPLGTSPVNDHTAQQSTERRPEQRHRNSQQSNVAVAAVPADVTVDIINDESFLDMKRSVDIRLNRPVSEDVLRAIATKLRSADSNYDKVFICYYLPGMEIDAGAWATSHFDPNLEIKVLSLTVDEKGSLAELATDDSRELIGSWLHDEDWFAGRITLFRRNDRVLMEKTYRDGSNIEKDIVEMSSNKGRQFMVAGRTDPGHDYYLILKNGGLQTWSSDADAKYVLVSTADPIGEIETEQPEKEIPYRTWTSDNGKYTVDARFVEFRNEQVLLEKQDGSRVKISPRRLSRPDQEFIRAELQGRQTE